MISIRRSELEPVASQTMGTPPVGNTSAAGSSSSRAAPRSFDKPVGDGSRAGGGRGEARAAGEGRQPFVRGRDARSATSRHPRAAQPPFFP